ncbi:helix-turn-helix transcriptional regulator [Dactylosporangium sp. AC04546]|uniref:helix-turn-helix domain-containing protein n=1 Tax=Dactylosporangium sp. AC04546 TaxID=2862460 RepID=UPI001EDFFD46|nr:helix-turn-helix transcriptional regulator [Dactylosporangium sp. AC04546]WVK80405.1 helix-turn-helix transcriptional regulator [Dactylosporangium sp. AC04546]
MVGVVSGFVLKLARQSTALTQERLAEEIGVDVSTVQGWESGRRPLSAVTAGDFLRLCGRLSRLGAPASTGRHLREAIEADQVLSTGIAAGTAWVAPDTHPLAASVHRWTITNLITWPIIGKLPQHLHAFTITAKRRGPVPAQPSLSAEQRIRFFNHLLTVAQRAGGADEALLRRQAVYLLGFDGRSEIVDWLRGEWHRAGRRRLALGDIAGLLEARSASVALAAAGDSTHLYDFVDHMTDGPGEVANLNYWAYWIGELSDEQTDDAFMFNADTRSWTGARLLQHLVHRLDDDSPLLPLNVCTLHALIASRPSLLTGRPAVRASLGDALAKLAATRPLGRTGRDQLAGLQYAVRIADR